ncbi:hypothetical protein F0L74_26185 [Chitinophaga agrisoli]|uniref:Uncharacterized protein n=1 Tax=Chitinophaga agrisoli TaxID=2607653 RepID=A0A5B2VLF3_9BACT|nr:hypothetical protein [Chitinophaga agrisoli]KAA2239684.1 hypothetical protein F0L74_26185 [Chitinophaga agrisoli]
MRSFLQRLHFPFYWYMNPFIRAIARLGELCSRTVTRPQITAGWWMSVRMVFLLFLLSPVALHAQHFGGNPPSLKWRQINTDTVRIIFPAGLEMQGQRVANIVHYLNHNTRNSIGNRQQKVDIVLQNQTLESNGYVMLGPFRSEFYLSPPPSSLELGSLKWEEQLALHEYRHVLQNMNFRQGISKVFSILGGQLGQAAVTNIAVPNWFWEGDAVTMETALSHQGRGRLPAFFDGFRGLMLDQRNYSYMKIRNGSYRDYVPDHYELGYLMSVYGRNHYGQTFWRDVTTDAVRFRGVFYPLSQSIKRRTGQNITGFYNATMQEYESYWKENATRPEITPATPLQAPAKVVTNYRYVYNAGPGQWIALKSSYQRIPAFYLVDSTGKEELITRPGGGFDDFFSYRNGRILWTEARYDPRWIWKDYSVIKLYDRASGHTSTITHHTKYFSPDISSDGQYIVAAFTSPQQQYGLHVLNAHTGAITKALPNPENWYYTYPRFSANEQEVISPVRNAHGQMALIQQNISTGAVTFLTPFSFNVMGAPVLANDTAYFSGSWKDVNNIYALPLASKQLFQVTDRPNSALHAAIDPQQQQLVFSEFTAGGYKLYRAPLQAGRWLPVDTAANAHSAWLRPDLKEGEDVLTIAPHHDYPVKKYPLFSHPFNLHIWVPTFDDPDYSLTLYGNNILNTTSTAIGYTYNRNEGSSALGADFLFGGWFPYLTAGVDYTFDRSALTQNRRRLYWNELDWHGGIQVPLLFSSGKYGRSLSLASTYHYLKTFPQGFKFVDDGIQYLNNTLVFNNQRIKALQNIYSHFGQYLYLQYTHSIGNVPAEQFYGRFDLYLPGLFPNHSLVLQGAYQQRDTMFRYSFSDNFVYARGYNEPFYSRIYKLGANYHFPIAYPDWGFAQLLYLLRLRGNVFYDYSRAYDFRNQAYTTYASTGGELFFDTKVGNTIPFSFGVRFSHLLDQDPAGAARNRVDFILPLQQLFSY